MLGSNQRPLPRVGSKSVTDTSCCVSDPRFFSVISLFSMLRLFGSVRFRSGSVAASLLHILKALGTCNLSKISACGPLELPSILEIRPHLEAEELGPTYESQTNHPLDV